MTSATTPPLEPGFARPATPGLGLPLYRMPLVWVAVLVPGAFLFFLFFLSPSL